MGRPNWTQHCQWLATTAIFLQEGVFLGAIAVSHSNKDKSESKIRYIVS